MTENAFKQAMDSATIKPGDRAVAFMADIMADRLKLDGLNVTEVLAGLDKFLSLTYGPDKPLPPGITDEMIDGAFSAYRMLDAMKSLANGKDIIVHPVNGSL